MGNILCFRGQHPSNAFSEIGTVVQQSASVSDNRGAQSKPSSASNGRALPASDDTCIVETALEDAQELAEEDRNLSRDMATSQRLTVTTNTILPKPLLEPDGLLLQSPEEMTEDVQLLSAIGAGAYAVVYRGVYQGGDVAVKLAVTDGAKMSWSEAFLASQLRHPHVVQTYVARGAVLSNEFIDSIFNTPPQVVAQHNVLPMEPSEDGLGNPRKTTHDRQGWRHVLSRCGALPGKCLLMLVQEHCDKGTLTKAIRSGLFRPLEDVRTEVVARRMLLRTATEICRGMIHLHAASVIHGDLKPANVLLTRSMADRRGFLAKIADFGLARLLQKDSNSVETSSFGTLAYMSPEAINGVYSKSSDVYAFGMVLWEMLVGERPYERLTVGRIMLGVSFEGLRPEWPEDHWPELCALGKRCLEQDPEARPSFRELAEALVALEEALRAESRRHSEEIKRKQHEEDMQQQQQPHHQQWPSRSCPSFDTQQAVRLSLERPPLSPTAGIPPPPFAIILEQPDTPRQGGGEQTAPPPQPALSCNTTSGAPCCSTAVSGTQVNVAAVSGAAAANGNGSASAGPNREGSGSFVGPPMLSPNGVAAASVGTSHAAAPVCSAGATSAAATAVCDLPAPALAPSEEPAGRPAPVPGPGPSPGPGQQERGLSLDAFLSPWTALAAPPAELSPVSEP